MDIDTVSVGSRLIDASVFEYLREDYSRPIVLAAMAFECQLADVVKSYERERRADRGTEFDESAVEDQLRQWGTIRRRIEGAGLKLTRSGFEAFVKSHRELSTVVESGFPSLTVGDVTSGLERHVFWPRNRILHFGVTDYPQSDAVRAINISRWALYAIEEMRRHSRLQNLTER